MQKINTAAALTGLELEGRIYFSDLIFLIFFTEIASVDGGEGTVPVKPLENCQQPSPALSAEIVTTV